MSPVPWHEIGDAHHNDAMGSRLDWVGLGPFVSISVVAVALTVWQVRVDRSVFERYFASLHPALVVSGICAVGAVALAHLQASSEFAMVGPGSWSDAASVVGWAVPLFALVAIGADVVVGYPEDMNVAWPDAVRFYPAIAVVVEIALHVIPIAVLVAVLGMPAGLDGSFARIAVPVALIEAAVQAVYATSISTAVFSTVHVLVFGVVQVWMFWRFGFVWMLGFRLVYYLLWHVAWGAARLQLLY